MFAIGVLFVAAGYVLVYHGINVLAWSRQPDTTKTRPVPMQYLLGVPLPTAPPTDVFHPPFTLSDVDRANAAIALGAPGGASSLTGTGAIPNSQLPPTLRGQQTQPNNNNQGVLPVVPGDPGSVGGPPPISGGGAV
jgi:hypothetical protein